MTAQRFGPIARCALSVMFGGATLLSCEAIAGYNGLMPRPETTATSDASSQNDANPFSDVFVDHADASHTQEASNDAATADATVDVALTDASVLMDASIADGARDADAGPCPILTGNDACATVPRFTSPTQIVDGIGDEFCDVPAMVFDVTSCPTLVPSGEPPPLAEKVYLRIAWSVDAFHLHVHVVDPDVIVNPDPASLWNGDAVEIFVAGTSGAGLTGSYNGTDDGGAIQIVLAPPGGGFPTRGQAFFNPGGSVHTSAPISASIYAGRLVDDGYELELRLPWVAFADPAVPGGLMAFDIAIGAQRLADAGGRELQCIISNTFVDGSLACGYPAGTAAQPWCDDRTWCQPELLP